MKFDEERKVYFASTEAAKSYDLAIKDWIEKGEKYLIIFQVYDTLP